MAETSTIPVNLRRLRKARGLSQDALAEKAGLSRAAYRNIESGSSEPRVRNLQAIATALAVAVQDLVAPAPELKAVRFRSLKRMRNREQILVDAANWLQDFNDVEELLSDRVESRLRSLRLGSATAETLPGLAAARLRERFGIEGDEPIRDICGLLEAHGIKVCQMPVQSHEFFGLSVAPEDGGPAIVVNTWERISVERWIFTAAHELGHLLLHLGDYDVGQTEESKDHEGQANAFAAAFLMPDEAFQKEWNETYGMGLVDRVLKVKRIFRVSYRTVLHRLASREPDPGKLWMMFQVQYKRLHGKTLMRDDEPQALARDAFRSSFPESSTAGEPEHLSRVDFPGDRLSRLVRKAVEDGAISLGRGAEILRLPLRDMREVSASWVG